MIFFLNNSLCLFVCLSLSVFICHYFAPRHSLSLSLERKESSYDKTGKKKQTCALQTIYHKYLRKIIHKGVKYQQKPYIFQKLNIKLYNIFSRKIALKKDLQINVKNRLHKNWQNSMFIYKASPKSIVSYTKVYQSFTRHKVILTISLLLFSMNY